MLAAGIGVAAGALDMFTVSFDGFSAEHAALIIRTRNKTTVAIDFTGSSKWFPKRSSADKRFARKKAPPGQSADAFERRALGNFSNRVGPIARVVLHHSSNIASPCDN